MTKEHGPNIDRRGLLVLAGALTGGALTAPLAACQVSSEHRMPAPSGPRAKVAMLVHPKMVLLDLLGPMTVFNILRSEISLVWKDRRAVSTDVGLAVSPTATYDEYDEDPDILFVPGGLFGTLEQMEDAQTLRFLSEFAPRSRYITSVCTGSLVLGAAGLLNGRKATSHWGVTQVLPLLGATYVDERVVEDGNLITGGGVTAGIDFALLLATRFYGEEAARRAALTIEYAPEPPFSNGTPAEAGAERYAVERARRTGRDARAYDIAKAAGERLGIVSGL